MKDIPVVPGKRTTYENFIVDCPFCGKESVFNRASDLKTFDSIAGRDVTCLNNECKKAFRIVNDTINDAYAMLIFDCYELCNQKHYISCILNLVQAYEVFFALFFRVELLYKPFWVESKRKVCDMNGVAKDLHDKISKHAFAQMRALFLQHVLTRPRHSPQSIDEAAKIVDGFPKRPNDPSHAEITALHDPKLTPLLMALKKTKIHELRNNVAHKSAYRPTRHEVEEAIKEARSILFPLAKYFDLHDDINFYSRRLGTSTLVK